MPKSRGLIIAARRRGTDPVPQSCELFYSFQDNRQRMDEVQQANDLESVSGAVATSLCFFN